MFEAQREKVSLGQFREKLNEDDSNEDTFGTLEDQGIPDTDFSKYSSFPDELPRKSSLKNLWTDSYSSKENDQDSISNPWSTFSSQASVRQANQSQQFHDREILPQNSHQTTIQPKTIQEIEAQMFRARSNQSHAQMAQTLYLEEMNRKNNSQTIINQNPTHGPRVFNLADVEADFNNQSTLQQGIGQFPGLSNGMQIRPELGQGFQNGITAQILQQQMQLHQVQQLQKLQQFQRQQQQFEMQRLQLLQMHHQQLQQQQQQNPRGNMVRSQQVGRGIQQQQYQLNAEIPDTTRGMMPKPSVFQQNSNSMISNSNLSPQMRNHVPSSFRQDHRNDSGSRSDSSIGSPQIQQIAYKSDYGPLNIQRNDYLQHQIRYKNDNQLTLNGYGSTDERERDERRERDIQMVSGNEFQTIGFGQRREDKRTRHERYNGLMTSHEKELIARIQISQLVSDNPYADDFYYQVYSTMVAKKNATASPTPAGNFGTARSRLSGDALNWQQMLGSDGNKERNEGQNL
ncbi:hypothetical protein HK096_009044, partial [Nowakowskiella sp. JEL0078]